MNKVPYSTQIDDISGTLSDNDVSTEVLGMKFLPNSVIPDFGSIEKLALTNTLYLLEVDVDKTVYKHIRLGKKRVRQLSSLLLEAVGSYRLNEFYEMSVNRLLEGGLQNGKNT